MIEIGVILAPRTLYEASVSIAAWTLTLVTLMCFLRAYSWFQ